MFIASLNDQDINADEFVAQFGANYKKHKTKAECLICNNRVTLKNGLSDEANHFAHGRDSNCPIVTIGRRNIPYINGLEKNYDKNTALSLRSKIANNQNILINIYIRTHALAGGGNMGIWQFCKLLLLSIERDIWSLKETSIKTLPYLLVQLDDFPIMVNEYKVEKTKDNQFRFILALRNKKSRRKVFANYYLHKITLGNNERLWGCKIPTKFIESAKSNWLKEDMIKLLVERCSRILI